jgi:two-component system LytT family sensor kinase
VTYAGIVPSQARIPAEPIGTKKKLMFIGFVIWLTLALLDSTRQSAPASWKTLAVSSILWAMWAMLAPVIIWLDGRFPVQRDHLAKRLPIHVVLCIVLTLCTTVIHLFFTALILGPLPPRAFQRYFPGHVQIYWAVAGIYISYDYYTRFMERRLKAAELERRLAEAQLAALRAQLHPHFLFNALNAISAQMELDTRSARRMLEKVAELLRLSLAHLDDQEISLDQEIAFNVRYLELQKERYRDRLEFIENVDPQALEARVPPFVLQPLVENAIRHGIEKCSARGLIEISATRSNGHLVLQVRDNGPGMPPESRTPQGFGIGLTNTRERLRHLYGDTGQSMNITCAPGEGTLVEITIPFHSATPEQS